MSKKISELPVATLVEGVDTIAIVQGGVTKQATVDKLPFGDEDGAGAVTALSAVAGEITIDCSLGDYFTILLTTHITSVVFINPPVVGHGTSKLIRITQDNTDRAITWPASFKWPAGEPGVVSLGNGHVDVLAITTFNAGATWYATLAKDFA